MYPLASEPQKEHVEQASPPKEIIEWNILEKVENNIEPISVIEDINEKVTIESNIISDIPIANIAPNVKENIQWVEIEKSDIIAEEILSTEQNNLVADTKIEPLDITEIEVETIKTMEIDSVDAIIPVEEAAIVETISLQEKPSNEIHIWKAKRGSDLKEILVKWSDKEQIKLTWNLPDNYKIEKDIFISATFKNAIDVLFSKGLNNAPKYKLAKSPSYEIIIEK